FRRSSMYNGLRSAVRFGLRGSEMGRRLDAGGPSRLLNQSAPWSFPGREERVDGLILDRCLPFLRVDHQGLTGRCHPDQLIAQPEYVLRLRPAFKDAEVGVALRLDDDSAHLLLELAVNPDSSEELELAACLLALAGLSQQALLAQFIH